uniref:Secreted protein n=1 Tax=Rhipicephalus appendiculatus TaxID=34631 RepID=A0A131YE68_RHIAP
MQGILSASGSGCVLVPLAICSGGSACVPLVDFFGCPPPERSAPAPSSSATPNLPMAFTKNFGTFKYALWFLHMHSLCNTPALAE